MGCKDSNRYDKVPMSEKSKSGMSLKIEDILYLQRMFCLQDAAFEDVLEDREQKMLTSLAEIISSQNDIIFKQLELQTQTLMEVKKEIISINHRLDAIEAHMKTTDKRLDALEASIIRHDKQLGKIWGVITELKDEIENNRALLGILKNKD
jgi:septal ring factor EnvC (AmiA/AmiB activator)